MQIQSTGEILNVHYEAKKCFNTCKNGISECSSKLLFNSLHSLTHYLCKTFGAIFLQNARALQALI